MAVSLLLALLVAQPSEESIDEFLRPTRAERVRRAGGRSGPGFAFFEFAPPGGAGMGAVAPLPNWIVQSEDFTTSWTKYNFGSGSLPTITANYATAPDGTLTADRVQFSAVNAGDQSAIFQASGFTTGLATASVYVKGTSGSGSICVQAYLAAGSPYTECSYNSTTWTRCEHSATITSSGQMRIGNDAATCNAASARTAQDVLLWGAQWNVGVSTAAPYIATTTAAKGYTPTGAKGEALTFTRTGTAMATKTATGGLATTGIANGDLVLMPANQPRVEYDSNGTLGLLVESARTNQALRSQEFNNASWAKFNVTVAVPTVTADYAVAPDGTTTAERVEIPAVTTAQSSFIYQGGPASTAVASVWTVYVKGNGTSGTVDVCHQGGGSYVCTDCTYVSTSWTRCTKATASPTGTQVTIGNMGSSNSVPTARSAQDILVWGGQGEYGAGVTYATSYIPTTTGTATRNAETADFDLGASAPGGNSMSMAVTLTGKQATYGTEGTDMSALNLASDSAGSITGKGMWIYSYGGSAGATVRCLTANDTGSIFITGPSGASSGTVRGWCASTAGSTMTGEWPSGSTLATSSPQTGTFSPARYLRVGGQSSGACNCIKSRVCIDPSSTRCR